MTAYRGCINKTSHLSTFTAFCSIHHQSHEYLSRRRKTGPLTSSFVNCITLCPVSNQMI
jgi:hypothetical protein